jgi:hypothetical protein
MPDISQKQLAKKLKALGALPDDQRNKIVCALIGHSKIVTSCFGYINCARCQEQLGDTLGGCYELKDHVIVGHDCKSCRSNYKGLGWKDLEFTPSPFKKD